MAEEEDSGMSIDLIIIIIIRIEDIINRDNTDLEEGVEEDSDLEERDIKKIKIKNYLGMIRKLSNKLFIVH
jgi:hypothetical protein